MDRGMDGRIVGQGLTGKQMDKWTKTDKSMDGRTDGRVDGQKEGLTDIQTDGWVNERERWRLMD